MTTADVVSKVLCLYQGKPPPRQAGKTFFKNVGILRSSTRAETSTEMTLQEQLAGEKESTTALVELVDELKRKTKSLKGSLRNSRNDNRRSTIGSVSKSCT
jgi:hypothetical protein